MTCVFLPARRLGEGDALVLGLVGQHRAGDQIADGVDARHVRLKCLVHADPAVLLQRDARFLQSQAGGTGLRPTATSTLSPWNCTFSALGLRVDDHLAALRRGADDLGLQVEFQPLLGQRLVQQARDLAVAQRQDARQELDHRHLGPEPRPHRAQLQADVAAADHDQVCGHLVEASAPRSS